MVIGLKDNKKGFTLIEVMSGIVLTLLLLSLMSSFIFNTIKCYKTMNKTNSENEYLKQSIISIKKVLKNSSEVEINKSELYIKDIKHKMVIQINNSKDLIIKYYDLNREEIVASNIKCVHFYMKNNLIYIDIKNKEGDEIECSLPLNKV